MRLKYLSIVFLLLPIGCHYEMKRYTDDKQVEELLSMIKSSRYSHLINYLHKEPIKMFFNHDSSVNCPVINLEKREILIPRKSYQNFFLNSAYVAKSIYEYKIRNTYNLTTELPFEFKLLSSYFEIEFILNHLSNEVISEIEKDKKLSRKVCAYIMDEGSFEKIVDDEESIADKTCFRPSSEVNHYISTLQKLRDSLNNVNSEGFFRILHEIEIEKAKKGQVTFYEAYRNYYYETSKPEMELYRDIRKDIFAKLKSLKSFKRFYNSEIRRFKKTRKEAEELQGNFTFCADINKI